jgi:N-acetylmuramoyl-L-alanine amidase
MEKLLNNKRDILVSVFFLFAVIGFSVAQQKNSFPSVIKTVVIDPGHGGKDPGCHGASALEKTVCLSMALKLGEMIREKYPTIKVIYTRDKDVFVELDDRAKIANRQNADLFICIHANAASPLAFGTETYVLGLHRTESQQKIAERENATIYLEDDKGEKYKDFDLSPDAIIARQLQLSVFLDQSISFASKLQAEFKNIDRFDRGVKQAGFLVLYKTTMPSVLIETGFLTNSNEEKFLNSGDSQVKMATAMFVAFENYMYELEGLNVKSNSSAYNTPNKNAGILNKDKPTKDVVIFRVQIDTSEKKVSIIDGRFKGIEVSEYEQHGLFKYTSGNFENDYNKANDYKNVMRKKGFQHAFVVAFVNGERISLEKAINLAKK